MRAHLKLCCKLNNVALLFSPTCSCSRFSACLLNYTNSIITDNSYWKANPNLIFHRFQSDVKNEENILDGIKKFKNLRVSEYKIVYAFTIRREVAAKIANKVMSSVLKRGKRTTLIEINPGPGLISQELFNNELDKLVVYDCLFSPYFMKWFGSNRERINLIHYTVFSKHNFNLKLFYSLHRRKGVHYTVIVSLPHLRFFRRLFYHIAFIEWNLFTNVEFYVIISKTILNCLCVPNDKYSRTPNYGMCPLLFDIEILDEFKGSDFLPAGLYNDKLYFIHFARKAKPLLSKRDAQLYFLFLIGFASRKTNLIIKTLEPLFPGIGTAAIARGIKVTNCFRDLNGEELVKIYLLIRDLDYDINILYSISPIIGDVLEFPIGNM